MIGEMSFFLSRVFLMWCFKFFISFFFFFTIALSLHQRKVCGNNERVFLSKVTVGRRCKRKFGNRLQRENSSLALIFVFMSDWANHAILFYIVKLLSFENSPTPPSQSPKLIVPLFQIKNLSPYIGQYQ